MTKNTFEKNGVITEDIRHSIISFKKDLSYHRKQRYISIYLEDYLSRLFER